MTTFVDFITPVVVALAATALSHFGMTAEGLEPRSSEARSERTVKRSATPVATPSSRIAVR